MTGFALTSANLRVVARFAVQSAEQVLGIFEDVESEDPRPRLAVEAAWIFVNGAARTTLQRAAALDAHRAAAQTADDAAKHAARAAGDASAAAYLHPIAKATQVGHILRATANAARAAELRAGGDTAVGDAVIARTCGDATPTLIAVLCRFPVAPDGRTRVAQLMKTLDSMLRASTLRHPS